MTILRYALDRFRRMYLAEFGGAGYGPSEMVDYVVAQAVLPKGSVDTHELINWYETRARELRAGTGIGNAPLPDDCTCTEDPLCVVHGVPRAT